MKDKLFNYIEKEVSHEDEFVGEFSIKAKWSMGEDPSRLMEVSRFFNTKGELLEAGISPLSKHIIAYSPSGLDILLDMGFNKSEITEQYGK